jgi:tyrosine-protein kinase Etk/Wzc
MLVVGCLVLALALGGVYTLLAPRVYEATSVLRFEVEQVNLPQLVQLVSTENRINTELQILQNRSAAEAVIDSLGLRARVIAPTRARASEVFSLLRVAPTADTLSLTVRIGRDGFGARQTDSPFDEVSGRIGDTLRLRGVTLAVVPAARPSEIRLKVEPLDEAVRRFESNLAVSRPARDADLIAARVRSSDPGQAAAAANLLTQQLISNRHGVQLARTGSTVSFLKQQLDTLGAQLRLAEDTLRAYRERAGVVDAEEDARTQVRRLAQIQADRGAVEAERQALARLVQDMRSESSAGKPQTHAPSRRLVSFPTLFRNQAASELLGALAQVENQRSELLVRRKPEDPDVLVLTRRVNELDAQLQGIAETYLQGLTNQVAALEGVAAKFGSALNLLPKKEVQAARLQREVTVRQELYTLLQTRLKEAEITRAMEDPTVRIVDPAVVPDRPVSPKPLLNLALSLVLGSLLGVVMIMGRELTNRSVRTRADALFATGLPVLGAMPRIEASSRKLLPHPAQPRSGRRRHRRHRSGRRLRRGFGVFSKSERGAPAAQIMSRLVTRAETPAAYAESLNQLHVALTLAFEEHPPKVLVFTSPLPGEGKTLSAINFALSLAGRGVRVLLIDSDFRCGLVDEVFGVDRQPGFSELLSERARFEDCARRIPVGDSGTLVVLTAGELPADRGHGLAIARIREVLGALAPQFDLVIIDSPPVNLLADAALLGSAADGVLLIVRAGHTDAGALRFAADQLTAARAPVIGTLLNDIDLRRHTGDDDSYRYLAQVDDYYAAAR